MEHTLVNSWGVVRVKFPPGVLCDITNGYAVAFSRLVVVEHCTIKTKGRLLVARYSGFETMSHAIYHCDNFNKNNVPQHSKWVGQLVLVNTRFLADVI